MMWKEIHDSLNAMMSFLDRGIAGIGLVIFFSVGVFRCNSEELGARVSGGENSVAGGSGPGSVGPDSTEIIVADPSIAAPGDQPITPCDSEGRCANSLICADGTCRQPEGPCTTDVDCLGDTKCCIGDCLQNAGQEGVCVPNVDVDSSCRLAPENIKIGVFAPDEQCKWPGPRPDDPFPDHTRVMATPLVAPLPNDSGAAAEIIIVTSDESAGGDRDTVLDQRVDPVTNAVINPRNGQPARGGVIRILNGQTCEQVEVITTGPPASHDYVRAPSTPAIADLDGDGNLEIVTKTHGAAEAVDTASRVIAFRWNGTRYERFWIAQRSPGAIANNGSWDGVSIHDIDDDGKPEIIGRYGVVYDALTGAEIAPANTQIPVTADPVLGDVDGDGEIELVANNVYRWNGSGWVSEHVGPNKPANAAPRFYAFADFGTPGSGGFDYTNKDGIAEIVTSGVIGEDQNSGHIAIYTLDGQQLVNVPLGATERGGPPTIGDFDKDGFPEIAAASATKFQVVDPNCPPGECAQPNVRWSQPAVDASSAQTGSSIFDFEGDGKAEAVYADECFLRVYDGANGDVLFSAFRQSCTWLENAVIADPDNDSRTEIIVGSNINCRPTCPPIDPIHPGLRCDEGADCPSGGNCVEGLCRCTTDADCGNDFVPNPAASAVVSEGLTCTDPLPGTPGAGNVCRMQHLNSSSLEQQFSYNTVTVYRDVLDRWADSRPMWNQHAYSVTNINDNGTVPKSSQWLKNFRDPLLNNYRQNRQTPFSATFLPDITGGLDKATACGSNGRIVTLTGKVCNRGLRTVGANMPATFYLGEPDLGQVLCVSYTSGPIALGDECLPVACDIDGSVADQSEIVMVVNQDETGRATTEECNVDNNLDRIVIDTCPIVR